MLSYDTFPFQITKYYANFFNQKPSSIFQVDCRFYFPPVIVSLKNVVLRSQPIEKS